MMKLELPGRRSRGRPKKRFMDAEKEDMRLVGVREEDAEDRVRWRQRRSVENGMTYFGYLAILKMSTSVVHFPLQQM